MSETQKIVQQWFDHIAAGDAEAAFALFDEDIVYDLKGTTPVSGVYRGLEQIVNEFFTPWRKQIDGDYALQDRDLEIAWLEDDLDRYFLHIQGSGYLRFADGTVQSVRFDGSNRLPYKSVGRQMIADGVISENQGSMQGIKAYFRRHPEDIQRYLFQNRRYIFFELTDRGPTGSAGVELVPGRSIATDKSIYPGGGLAFITAKKPVLDADNRIVGWQTFSRFVLDQDTGSAIRGPGRADLYFGVGDSAGAAAGHYYQRGRIVYLLKKK